MRDQTFGRLLHAYLFKFDLLENVMKGGVVAQWERGADNESLILTLREGVCFSDGEPLTAAHVVATFQKIFEEESSNPLKDTLTVGGKALKAN